MWKVAKMALFGIGCYAIGLASRGCSTDGDYDLEVRQDTVYVQDARKDTVYDLEKLIRDSELIERIRKDGYRQ